MIEEPTSGPCSYPAAKVDEMLEDRDRLWCLALISAVPSIGIDRVHRILDRYIHIRSKDSEILVSLRNGPIP